MRDSSAWAAALALALAACDSESPRRAPPPVEPVLLAGWAEPAGPEVDAATGYPRRIRRTKDDGEMVLVPAGTFRMGAVAGDALAEPFEMPGHEVTLTHAYYLDATEVTVG